MTDKEMRELDVWIWKTLFKGKIISKRFSKMRTGFKLRDEFGDRPNCGGLHGWGWQSSRESALIRVPHYTTGPDASDALDDAILEKLEAIQYSIYKQGGLFVMKAFPSGMARISVSHSDKKICRALFAKKLFAK